MHEANHYYAVIHKKVEKDSKLQAKVIEQLEVRQNLSSNHIGTQKAI